MELEQKELTLGSGKTGWYEYDREGDLLEIIFRKADATCAVELTESIVLRFDRETNEPLSLSFLSISKLLKPAEYGFFGISRDSVLGQHHNSREIPKNLNMGKCFFNSWQKNGRKKHGKKSGQC